MLHGEEGVLGDMQNGRPVGDYAARAGWRNLASIGDKLFKSFETRDFKLYCHKTVVNASSISRFKRLLSDVDLSSFACCTYF